MSDLRVTARDAHTHTHTVDKVDVQRLLTLAIDEWTDGYGDRETDGSNRVEQMECNSSRLTRTGLTDQRNKHILILLLKQR